MATLDLVADEIAKVLSTVPGITRVVDLTDDIGDAGVVGVVEIKPQIIPHFTLNDDSAYYFTLYVMKQSANNAQSRRELAKLPQAIIRKFGTTGPTTCDFWLIRQGFSFGPYQRNNQFYQGLTLDLQVVGSFN